MALLNAAVGFLRHSGGLRFLPGAHSAFLVVQICQAQRVANVQNFCLAQPAALQRDHNILFLCARYNDSRLAQNAVLDTGAGGAACQQGHGRVGNALQTFKGLVEHFADFLGQCRVEARFQLPEMQFSSATAETGSTVSAESAYACTAPPASRERAITAVIQTETVFFIIIYPLFLLCVAAGVCTRFRCYILDTNEPPPRNCTGFEIFSKKRKKPVCTVLHGRLCIPPEHPSISFFAFQIEKSEPRGNVTKNRRFIKNSFDVLLLSALKSGTR